MTEPENGGKPEFVTQELFFSVLKDTAKNLLEEQVETPPEFEKILAENFWDLLA